MSNYMRDLWLKKHAPDAFAAEQAIERKRLQRRSGNVKRKSASRTSLFPDLYRNEYDDVWLEKAMERHHRSRRMFPDLF